MKKLETFVISSIVNPSSGDFNAMNELMKLVQDETTKYIQDLAVELKISKACAMDVYYLRTRSRWTQELEDQLIDLHAKGTVPNMCEYGCKV